MVSNQDILYHKCVFSGNGTHGPGSVKVYRERCTPTHDVL